MQQALPDPGRISQAGEHWETFQLAELARALEVVKEVVSGEWMTEWQWRGALRIHGRSGTLDAASKAEEVQLVDHDRTSLSEVRRVVD